MSTYRVTMLSRSAAEAHDRRVHNVEPRAILGWTPYTIRVTYDAVVQVAFVHAQDFFRWLDRNSLRLVTLEQRHANVWVGTLARPEEEA